MSAKNTECTKCKDIFDAVRRKHDKCIKHYKSQIFDEKDGNTPLHVACGYCGVKRIVKLLLELGASANIKGSDGFLPLVNACSNDSFGCVKLLLENGAADTINAKDDDGYSAAMYFALDTYFDCDFKDDRIIMILIDYGSDYKKEIESFTYREDEQSKLLEKIDKRLSEISKGVHDE